MEAGVPVTLERLRQELEEERLGILQILVAAWMDVTKKACIGCCCMAVTKRAFWCAILPLANAASPMRN